MNRLGRLIPVSLCLFAAVGLLAPTEAEAMPGFARKYRISCTTCHAPFPNLKDFANEFAGLGFRMPDAAQEPSRATLETGDPLLMLSRDVPLGFRLEGFASFEEDARAEADLEFPWTWKILSGGPISDTAAYYFYFLIERGELVGLEDAYIQLNSVFGLPVDLLAGQFQVCDPMFKREARLERTDYLIYKTTVGSSNLNLTYDRGIVLATAVDRVDVVLQVINGNGIPHADEDRNFDDDIHKNVALHLGGGAGSVGLGLFGYWGKQEDVSGHENETWYFGPNATVSGGPVIFNAQYLERRDDNALFAAVAPGTDLETRGGFAELHYFPEGVDGRWVLSGLYNRVESDDPSAERETVSLTVNRLLARNLRLLVEGGNDIHSEKMFGATGLIAAF